MKQTSSSGFTLVELAIVLMIIGLLIGGILRGQELLDNARVNGTIQQVNAYQGAYVTFRDSYAANPGDLATAMNRVPGCTAANSCGNGDGDGMVGRVLPIGSGYDGAQAGLTTMPQAETSYFWKHMALAHLISGVNPSANIVNYDWGSTHPSAKIGGGFIVFYSNIATDWGAGHILKLQSGPRNAGGRGLSPLSPIKARMIDQKMDDGMPDRGSVNADSEGSNCDPGGQYAVTEEKNCVMYFTMD